MTYIFLGSQLPKPQVFPAEPQLGTQEFVHLLERVLPTERGCEGDISARCRGLARHVV